MERPKNIYGIKNKSKLICKTPAQDRLKALQKHLQTELKESQSSKIHPLKQFIKQSCDKEKSLNIKCFNFQNDLKSTKKNQRSQIENSLQKRLDVHRKFENHSNEKESQIEGKLNYSAIKNGVPEVIEKQLIDQVKNETPSSHNNNNIKKEIESSFIKIDSKNLWNNRTQEIDNVDKKMSLQKDIRTQKCSEKSVLNKIKSVWKSVKNVWDTNTNKDEKNVKLRKKELKNVNFDTEDATSSELKEIKKVFETTRNKNNIENKERSTLEVVNIKSDQKIKKLCTELKIDNNILKLEDQDNYKKSDEKQKSLKRKSNESDESFKKKLKLNNTPYVAKYLDKERNQLDLKNLNIPQDPKSTSVNSLEKSLNSIIPITPEPGRKFSANERLVDLRKQINKIVTPQAIDNRAHQEMIALNQKLEPMELDINLNKEMSNNKSNSDHSNEDDALEKYNIVNNNLLNLVKNNKDLHKSSILNKKFFYVVPDTNVFLNNLSFLTDLTKSKLCDSNSTVLYIPYIVIQELDRLKMQTERSISVRASRAIKYLNDNLTIKNPHFVGQSAYESKKFLIDIENSDDHIINCCLLLKSYNLNYILLSNDINLRNKAICNQIICSTKDDLESNEYL